MVANVVFGNTGAQNIEVKLFDRFGERERRMLVNEDSEGRNDFAEFFMVLEFDKIPSCTLIHIVEVVFCEGSNFFGEPVVGEINVFRRIELNVFFGR